MIMALAVLVPVATAEDHEYFPQSVASGDPRPTSVVLWTRIDNPEMPDAIRVDVATDEVFTDVVFTRDLTASADNDWCLKVLATGLMPYTTYYYRFVYGSGAAMVYSPVGRTKTAPTPDMDVPARFAVVYCQDYTGRYYNSYAKLLADYDEEIDFVVHLGDYIYETTGGSTDDPEESDRTIVFEDLEGAIPIGSPDEPRLAAGSLANYRTIYKTYRSDPMLRKVHERWPMMVIWDDHEFSNDHWGATATYTNGRSDEYNPDRRRNAEQAFFEWIPIEVGIGDEGTLEIDASILYPNTRIYRDFIYGSNLHLVLPDSRTYRPDHLVPEDAFPGTIAIDQEDLITVLSFVGLDFAEVRDQFDPYIDMDLIGSALPIFKQTTALIVAGYYQLYNPALDTFSAVRVAEEALEGNVSATFINLLWAQAGLAPPLNPDVLAFLPRGVSYLLVNKTAPYSSLGSRTFVAHDTFNLLAIHRYLETGGAAQEVYGGEQTAWIQGTMLMSPAKWKVLGQSTIMTPLVIDFTNPLIAAMLPPDFPDMFRIRLGITVEDFNGFPQKRLEMLGLLSVVPDSVVISGDIHSTFVTDHKNGVFEFTPPSVSSATLAAQSAAVAATDPILSQIPGIEFLIAQFDLLFQVSAMDPMVSTSDIVYSNNFAQGFMVMEAMAESLTTTIYEIPNSEVVTSYYDDPDALDELFTMLRFTVQDGILIPG
jgi:alkaline phosphatase D